MADKTIGELPQAKQVLDTSMIPLEQSGEAMRMSGAQFKEFAKASVQTYAQQAADSATAAAGSAAASEKSAQASATSAANAAQSEKEAKEYSGKPPIIQDGRWWTWNATTQKYVDTGEAARGNLMYATFAIDPATGELWMYTDAEYTGPTFRLVDGDLEVVLNVPSN